ncbi:MAG: hypothetical protein M3014_09390, partial [Chloroflexota bacterium]|nr:hypothetical protein [Chloroflexota bacterium]
PGMVLLFSVAAYLIGYGAKGGDLLAVRAGIVSKMGAEAPAEAVQLFGLFSPTRQNYTLQINAESALSEITDMPGGPAAAPPVVLGGNPTQATGVKLDTWSLRSFLSESTLASEAPLRGELHIGNNTIEGSVTNSSGTTLQDVALVRGDAVQFIGSMAPSAAVPVHMSLSAGASFSSQSLQELLPLPSGVRPPVPGGYYSGPSNRQLDNISRSYYRRLSLLGFGLQYRLPVPSAEMDVLALSWGGPAASEFNIQGQAARIEDISLWGSKLAISAPPSGASREVLPAGSVLLIIYAPGNTPSRFVGRAETPHVSLPGPVPTLLPAGSTPPPATGPGAPGLAHQVLLSPYADATYFLPSGTSPQSLAIEYELHSSDGLPLDVQMYNVESGAWDLLGSLGNGTLPYKGVLPVQAPVRYVAPGGQVTLRLLAHAGNARVDLSTLDLVLNKSP